MADMSDIMSDIRTKAKIPHVFSRLDPDTKKMFMDRYKTIKMTGIATSFSVAGASGFVEIAKDIIRSKLKAYGYKTLFLLTIGPSLQIFSLPFYIFSYGSKIRTYINIVMEFGAVLTRGEFELVNLGWIISDFALFGEHVPITTNCTFKLIHNETGKEIAEVINKAFNNTEV